MRHWGRDPVILIVVLALLPLFASSFGIQATGGYLALAMLAISFDFAWGYGGIMSLCHGAFFALGAYTVGIVTTRVSGTPVAVGAVILGAVVAGAVAYALGRLIFTRRQPTHLFVATVTLAFGAICGEVVLKLPGLTGAHNGLILTTTFLPFDPVAAYYVMFAVFAVTLVAMAWLVRSDLGRYMVAVREHEERLRFLGGNTRRMQTWALALSAAVAGLAGAMYGPYVQIASPDLFALPFSVMVLVWVAVGGRGTLVGPAAVAIVVSVIGGELSGDALQYWQLGLGVIFIAVVVWATDGVYPAIRRLLPRVRMQPPQVRAEASANAQEPAGATLEVGGVGKRYGSLAVLRDVTLSVAPGELRCLIGSNGAGKSSLIDVVSGRQSPTTGSVSLRGRSILGLPPDKVAALGLQRTFQATAVFDGLTVGENMFLAARASDFGVASLARRRVSVELPEASLRLLETGKLLLDLERPVASIGHGARKWLELAMVMARNPSIVLLDEPTAGLTRDERASVGVTLRGEVARGVTIVVVEHDIDFVRDIADSVTVLHQGEVIADGSVEDISGDTGVRRIYLGEAL